MYRLQGNNAKQIIKKTEEILYGNGISNEKDTEAKKDRIKTMIFNFGSTDSDVVKPKIKASVNANTINHKGMILCISAGLKIPVIGYHAIESSVIQIHNRIVNLGNLIENIFLIFFLSILLPPQPNLSDLFI